MSLNKSDSRLPASFILATVFLLGCGDLLQAQQPAATGSPASPPSTASAAPGTPAVPGAGPASSEAPAETSAVVVPLSHRPYKVIVEVGFSGSGLSHASGRNYFLAEIRSGLKRMYGHMWNAEIVASKWLVPADAARLARLTEAEMETRYESAGLEKVILVSVSAVDGAWVISSREYDTRVRELSPLLVEQTEDEQSVGNTACRLVRDCFRPVLMFQNPSVDKTELEFEVQAGTLIPPDPTAAQLMPGDVLRPFLRQMERRNPGKVKLLQKLDLCYVRLTSLNTELKASALPPSDTAVQVKDIPADDSAVYIDSGHAKGVLISHGPVPFGGRGRSVEQIGLRQRPSAKSSRVKLVLQSRPDRPLVCFRVDKVSKLRQTDVNEVPGVRMLSDRNGDIQIDVDAENPTFWLYVYSGSVLLARVPYAPGLVPQDTMKLPDDSVRLGVEGELYLLRDQLVDMVAQKAVNMSLAKKAAASGDVAALESAIAQLDALPGQKRFEELLNKIRSDAAAKADQQKNSVAKRKVESLCKKMGESLTLFFAADKRVKDAEEIEKLRQSAENRAATAAPAP